MKDNAGMAGTAGAFPNVVTQDDSAPGAHDGTPLLDQWLRDLFGGFQALLNGATITPSGVAETCGAAAGNLTGSQLAEAIQLIAGYPGEIFLFPTPYIGGNLILPTGIRALKLEGQTIAMADYPRLDGAVYCGDVSNGSAPAFWHASDTPGTVRNVVGPYLVLPDLRGQFVRGLDRAAATDPGGAARIAATEQLESINEHEHDGLFDNVTEYKANLKNIAGGAVGTATLDVGGNSFNAGATGTGIGTIAATKETRPVNMAFAWCIRY